MKQMNVGRIVLGGVVAAVGSRHVLLEQRAQQWEELAEPVSPFAR